VATVQFSNPWDIYSVGDIADLDADTARRLVNAGYAVYVGGDPTGASPQPIVADYEALIDGQVLVWNGTTLEAASGGDREALVNRTGASAGEVPTLQADGTLAFEAAAAGSGAGVDSFNTRSGAVVLSKADVTGTGLAAGDVGAQPVDADLTAIAGLDAATAGTIGSDGAGWVKKTWAQAKAALGLAKADVGLGNVDNTSDVNKPVSTAQQAALNAKADLVGGVIPTAQIPAIATGQTVSVASQAAMLALTAAQVQPGDVAIRTDQAGRRWLLAAADPSALANWIQLETPDAVTTVNGQAGAVVLSAANVGAQPSDADLTAIAALDATSAGMIASDGAGWIKKTYVQAKAALGLGNVDNTSDVNKPVSTAQQTALDAKLGLAAAQGASVNVQQNTASTAYTDLTTAGPAVTVTIGASGRALVLLSADASNSIVGDVAAMAFAVSGATTRAAQDEGLWIRSATSANGHEVGTFVWLTGLTPGVNTFTAKYKAGIGGTATFNTRSIVVIPL
jgi:hypothetical protein